LRMQRYYFFRNCQNFLALFSLKTFLFLIFRPSAPPYTLLYIGSKYA